MARAATPALLLATTLLGACGASTPDRAAAPTILDTEKVERAIEASTLSQRRQTVRVSCPSGVHQRKGLVFSCVAEGAGARTTFVVRQLDGAGRVHYEAP